MNWIGDADVLCDTHVSPIDQKRGVQGRKPVRVRECITPQIRSQHRRIAGEYGRQTAHRESCGQGTHRGEIARKVTIDEDHAVTPLIGKHERFKLCCGDMGIRLVFGRRKHPSLNRCHIGVLPFLVASRGKTLLRES